MRRDAPIRASVREGSGPGRVEDGRRRVERGVALRAVRRPSAQERDGEP